MFSANDKTIRYDKELDDDAQKRLLVIAHEAGHIVLHDDRLTEELRRLEPSRPISTRRVPPSLVTIAARVKRSRPMPSRMNLCARAMRFLQNGSSTAR